MVIGQRSNARTRVQLSTLSRGVKARSVVSWTVYAPAKRVRAIVAKALAKAFIRTGGK